MKIAIIGNGPSPVGKRLGERIDSMDIVVRMHDCHHHLGSPIDYGRKYNYGIIPSPWFNRALEGIYVKPDNAWLVYTLSKQKRKKKHPKNLYGVKVKANEIDFNRHLNGLKDYPPTRGLSAIVLSLIYLNPREINLVGFDSVITGKISQYHKSFPAQVDSKYVGSRKNSRHNFLLESKKVKELQNKYKIPIQDISLCT